jgi:hypothetical protein
MTVAKTANAISLLFLGVCLGEFIGKMLPALIDILSGDAPRITLCRADSFVSRA